MLSPFVPRITHSAVWLSLAAVLLGVLLPGCRSRPTPLPQAQPPHAQPGSMREATTMTQSLRRLNVRAEILLITPVRGAPYATSAFQHHGVNYVWDSRWGAARIIGPFEPNFLARSWLLNFGIPGQSRQLARAEFLP